MKTILEFTHPEDNDDLKHAQLGNSYYCTLHEIVNVIFHRKKFDHRTDAELKVFQELREEVLAEIRELNEEGAEL